MLRVEYLIAYFHLLVLFEHHKHGGNEHHKCNVEKHVENQCQDVWILFSKFIFTVNNRNASVAIQVSASLGSCGKM